MIDNEKSQEEKKVGTCVVCHKNIVRLYVYKDRGRQKGHSRNAYNTTTVLGNLYCSGCGLMYQFVPPKSE